MLLQRLKIQNFLIFKDVDLDLSEVKLTSIIGQFVADKRRSNGSGKTALLEAIRYALFDQTRSKQKLGIVHQGVGTCVVELEFNIGHRAFKIYRSRTSNGTSAAKIWVDGKAAGDKITVVNNTVKQYLGLDADLFDLVYFFKQRDQFGFAQATPADRKAVLAKVFKMQHVLRCLEISKVRHSDASDAFQRANGRLEGAQQRLASTQPRMLLEQHEEETSELLCRANQRKVSLGEYLAELRKDSVDFDTNYAAFEEDIASKAVEAEELAKRIQVFAEAIAKEQAASQQQAAQTEGVRTQVEALTAQAASSSDDLDVLSDEQSKWRLNQTQVSNRIAIIDSELQRLGATQAAIRGQAGVECSSCYQVVPVDHVEGVMQKANEAIVELTQEKTALQADGANALSNIQRIEGLKSAAQAANAANAQLTQAKEHLKTLDKAEKVRQKTIADMHVERNGLALQHSEKAAQMKAFDITATRERLLGIRKALDFMLSSTDNNLTAATNEVIRLSGILSSQQAEIVKRDEIEAEVEKSLAAARSASREVQIYSYVTHAFSKNGFPAIMLENAIGVIEQFANDVLSQMQTRFTVSLRTQKETKQGDAKETLDIIVYDNGTERPFENYSGGEQTLVNLALRLALSRIISSLHGVSMQSLFLDEVLAELDEVNREEAVKIVAFLAKSYEQVFIISHTDEIKDIIDSALVIQRHDAHSEVRLTNGKPNAA